MTELHKSRASLPENILDAIKDLKNIKKGSAKKRQSLYLAKLLREIDLSKAQDFVNHSNLNHKLRSEEFMKLRIGVIS